jgi:hypothetical protein
LAFEDLAGASFLAGDYFEVAALELLVAGICVKIYFEF